MISKYESFIAEKNLNIEKSKISPTASLNYTKSENSELSSTIDKTDEEKVMATIRWPIIKGGKNFSSIKSLDLTKKKQNCLTKIVLIKLKPTPLMHGPTINLQRASY